MTVTKHSTSDERFASFMGAFGVTFDGDSVKCSWESYGASELDNNHLKMIAMCMLLEKDAAWKIYYTAYMMGDAGSGLPRFVSRQSKKFSKKYESLRTDYWNKYGPKDTCVPFNGMPSPLGGEVLSTKASLHYSTQWQKVGEIVNTGVHCLDGETVMEMAQDGDEIALHWLDYCEWMADQRRNRK